MRKFKWVFIVYFLFSFNSLHTLEIDKNPLQTLLNFSEEVDIANDNLRRGIFIERTDYNFGLFIAKTFAGETIYSISNTGTFIITWTSINDPNKTFFNHIFAAFIIMGGISLNDDNQKVLELDQTSRINIHYLPDKGITEIAFHVTIKQ